MSQRRRIPRRPPLPEPSIPSATYHRPLAPPLQRIWPDPALLHHASLHPSPPRTARAPHYHTPPPPMYSATTRRIRRPHHLPSSCHSPPDQRSFAVDPGPLMASPASSFMWAGGVAVLPAQACGSTDADVRFRRTSSSSLLLSDLQRHPWPPCRTSLPGRCFHLPPQPLPTVEDRGRRQPLTSVPT